LESSYRGKSPIRSSYGNADDRLNGGGVTVVSSRTPARDSKSPTRSGVQQMNANPQQQQQQSASNRPNPGGQSTKYSFQQPQQQAQTKPYATYSQRIDTNSTPLQLPPVASNRANSRNSNEGNITMKEGATDV
jgi:hypothetical protein